MRSSVPRDIYIRRLRILFNYIRLHHNEGPMEVRCNEFASIARSDELCLLKNLEISSNL